MPKFLVIVTDKGSQQTTILMCVKWIVIEDFLRQPLSYQKIPFYDKSHYVCLAKHFHCTLNEMSFSPESVLRLMYTCVPKHDFIFIGICYE